MQAKHLKPSVKRQPLEQVYTFTESFETEPSFYMLIRIAETSCLYFNLAPSRFPLQHSQFADNTILVMFEYYFVLRDVGWW